MTVVHVVGSLRAALKAADAGVDALVVEGVEGGGFKSALGASTMVLLPLVAAHVDLPIIAAGGMCDAQSAAAALVLGAEGVQMGTRMLASREVVGARELQERDRRRQRLRHGPPRRSGQSDDARASNRSGSASGRARPGRQAAGQDHASCTSTAIWKPASPTRARFPRGSPICFRWPRSCERRGSTSKQR